MLQDLWKVRLMRMDVVFLYQSLRWFCFICSSKKRGGHRPVHQRGKSERWTQPRDTKRDGQRARERDEGEHWEEGKQRDRQRRPQHGRQQQRGENIWVSASFIHHAILNQSLSIVRNRFKQFWIRFLFSSSQRTSLRKYLWFYRSARIFVRMYLPSCFTFSLLTSESFDSFSSRQTKPLNPSELFWDWNNNRVTGDMPTNSCPYPNLKKGYLAGKIYE